MRYSGDIAKSADIPTKPKMAMLLKGIESLWEGQSTNVIILDLKNEGYETYKGKPLDECKRSIAQLVRYIREARERFPNSSTLAI